MKPLPKQGLIVLCGPAGSGKTTFATRYFEPTQIVSSDRLRGMISDDEADQAANRAVFSLLRSLVRYRLLNGRLTVVDSTALYPGSRSHLLRLAGKVGAPTIAILFDVDLDTCIARNAARNRNVPEDVLRRQYRAFERSKRSIPNEGFGDVLRLGGFEAPWEDCHMDGQGAVARFEGSDRRD